MQFWTTAITIDNEIKDCSYTLLKLQLKSAEIFSRENLAVLEQIEDILLKSSSWKQEEIIFLSKYQQNP